LSIISERLAEFHVTELQQVNNHYRWQWVSETVIRTNSADPQILTKRWEARSGIDFLTLCLLGPHATFPWADKHKSLLFHHWLQWLQYINLLMCCEICSQMLI